MKVKIVFFISLLAISLLAVHITPNAKTILDEMMLNISKINTISYSLKTTERVNGKYINLTSKVKINTYPRKLYLSNPDKKLEVLYSEGENDGDAIVNPGKFPFITLNLNPHKKIMRNGQHHSIDDLGFTYISQMISSNIKKDDKLGYKNFVYTGPVDWEGKICFKIYAEFPDFKYVNYTAVNDINIVDVARKFNCGDFRIIEKNNLDFNEVISKGTTIKVPNMYASKMLMYVDRVSKLPILIKVFDNDGLYEVYEFDNIEVNKSFAKDEFTKSYSHYNFK